MPKKKQEETAEETVGETNENEVAAPDSTVEENRETGQSGNSIAAAPSESSDESASAAVSGTSETEDAVAEPSILDSVIDTVTTVAGTVASAVSDGVSSVVSTVSASLGETEEKGKTKSKRAEKIGVVASDKMTKTVTVRVDRVVKHQIYRKYIKRRKKFMAHDETGAAIGDKVRIVETRPLSAKKRWRVVEIIQKAEK